MLKGNIGTACINFGMSELSRDCSLIETHPLIPPSVSFAMLTLYLSRRDEKRAAAKEKVGLEEGPVTAVEEDLSRKNSIDKVLPAALPVL